MIHEKFRQMTVNEILASGFEASISGEDEDGAFTMGFCQPIPENDRPLFDPLGAVPIPPRKTSRP